MAMYHVSGVQRYVEAARADLSCSRRSVFSNCRWSRDVNRSTSRTALLHAVVSTFFLLTTIERMDPSCRLLRACSDKHLLRAHFQGKHPVTIRSTLTVFSQLAVAIVFDLGLNKQVAKEPPQLTCIPPPHLRPPQRPPRTMEERRAVLGTFVSLST